MKGLKNFSVKAFNEKKNLDDMIKSFKDCAEFICKLLQKFSKSGKIVSKLHLDFSKLQIANNLILSMIDSSANTKSKNQD